MDVWEEIRVLWLEVRQYKWKCHNIPDFNRGQIWKLVKLYKEQHPQQDLRTSPCKLPQTITIIGRTLAGRGMVEEALILRR